MKPIKFGLTIAAALVAFGVSAQQQPPETPSGKVGFVDPQRVMRDSKTTNNQKKSLDDKTERIAKEIEAGAKDQIERRMRALEADINVEREDALRQFVERTNRIIRRIAMEENIDVVFLEAAYHSPRVDLTDKVIKLLDSEP